MIVIKETFLLNLINPFQVNLALLIVAQKWGLKEMNYKRWTWFLFLESFYFFKNTILTVTGTF